MWLPSGNINPKLFWNKPSFIYKAVTLLVVLFLLIMWSVKLGECAIPAKVLTNHDS